MRIVIEDLGLVNAGIVSREEQLVGMMAAAATAATATTAWMEAHSDMSFDHINVLTNKVCNVRSTREQSAMACRRKPSGPAFFKGIRASASPIWVPHLGE